MREQDFEVCLLRELLFCEMKELFASKRGQLIFFFPLNFKFQDVYRAKNEALCL